MFPQSKGPSKHGAAHKDGPENTPGTGIEAPHDDGQGLRPWRGPVRNAVESIIYAPGDPGKALRDAAKQVEKLDLELPDYERIKEETSSAEEAEKIFDLKCKKFEGGMKQIVVFMDLFPNRFDHRVSAQFLKALHNYDERQAKAIKAGEASGPPDHALVNFIAGYSKNKINHELSPIEQQCMEEADNETNPYANAQKARHSYSASRNLLNRRQMLYGFGASALVVGTFVLPPVLAPFFSYFGRSVNEFLGSLGLPSNFSGYNDVCDDIVNQVRIEAAKEGIYDYERVGELIGERALQCDELKSADDLTQATENVVRTLIGGAATALIALAIINTVKQKTVQTLQDSFDRADAYVSEFDDYCKMKTKRSGFALVEEQGSENERLNREILDGMAELNALIKGETGELSGEIERLSEKLESLKNLAGTLHTEEEKQAFGAAIREIAERELGAAGINLQETLQEAHEQMLAGVKKELGGQFKPGEDAPPRGDGKPSRRDLLPFLRRSPPSGVERG